MTFPGLGHRRRDQKRGERIQLWSQWRSYLTDTDWFSCSPLLRTPKVGYDMGCICGFSETAKL